MNKKLGVVTKNTEFLNEMFKKVIFPLLKGAIYVIKSKVLYLGQILVDLDEIWYKSRPTHRALTQIKSQSQLQSKEK